MEQNQYSPQEIAVAEAEEWSVAFHERHARAVNLHIELRRAQARVVELEARVAELEKSQT